MIRGISLTRRFLLVNVGIIVAIILAFHAYSVPLIKQRVFAIERNASRVVLDNMFTLAERMRTELDDYREQLLEAQRQRLGAMIDTTALFLANDMGQALDSDLALDDARRQVLSRLAALRIGGDALWVADEDHRLLVHPAPAPGSELQGAARVAQAEAVLAPIIDSAVAQGEGFYRYLWSPPDSAPMGERLAYVRHFPQWHLLMGAGVSIDGIDAKVAARRHQVLDDLRQAFSRVSIAESGYLFIFDGAGRILLHPSQASDLVDMAERTNPITGRPILQDLMAVADSGEELHYRWDRPEDPGDYRHDKLSLVRYLPGFDWYICSSVYLAELQASSEMLAKRILVIACVALLAAIVVALIFVSYITHPIRRLAETASRISAGDLRATTHIHREDEIGLLARAFDRMVYRLRSAIDDLDEKVRDRTRILEQRNRQLRLAMGEIRSRSQELHLMEERQRLILDALPVQIACIDRSRRYILVNQGYAEAFGLAKAEVIGNSLSAVIGDTMFEDIRERVNQALAGASLSFEYPLTRGGDTRMTRRTLLPFAPQGGAVVGLISLSMDITDERENERRMAQAQRMLTVGQLAGGLAHDFNNLLSILQGNLLALQENPATVPALRPHIEPAIRATQRGTHIIRRLLAFARRQPLETRPIDLPLLMNDCMQLIGGTLPDNIQQQLEVDPDLWHPLADPGQLEDALVNLALNARSAMPQGGELRYRLNNRPVVATLVLDDRVPPGDYVEITVMDSGKGFSAEALNRAFEPFYTTSRGENGSGLGLSMVYGFVKQSAGYIALANRPEGGARVTLLLPAERIRGASTDARLPALPGGDGGLVLLVDDEDDVREVIRNQLIQLNYQVIECHDGEEAATLIDSLPPLRALVADVVMPGSLNGYQLARRLRARQPDAALLLISGFAPEYPYNAVDCRPLPLLQKPFSREQLGEALASEAARQPLLDQQGREPCRRS